VQKVPKINRNAKCMRKLMLKPVSYNIIVLLYERFKAQGYN